LIAVAVTRFEEFIELMGPNELRSKNLASPSCRGLLIGGLDFLLLPTLIHFTNS
jgi:hypothetical protein